VLPRLDIPLLPATVEPVLRQMDRLERLTDPRSVYAYCLACIAE
jgi:hypothetical protein